MNTTLAETDRTQTPVDQDMNRLHDDDLHAARIVVGLMTSVFLMGLLLYLFIMLVVW